MKKPIPEAVDAWHGCLRELALRTGEPFHVIIGKLMRRYHQRMKRRKTNTA